MGVAIPAAHPGYGFASACQRNPRIFSFVHLSLRCAALFLSISHEVEPCHGAMRPCTASVMPLLCSLHSILIRLTNISRQPIVMFTALCLFPSLDLVIERFV